MKQKLLKLMCLLCVSMMGVSAWGESEVVILSEDFSSITTGNSTETGGSSASWTDVNDNFPKASRISAYKAGGAVKLGGKSSVGSLTTKSLNLSGNGGKYIVQFDVKGWSSVEGSIKVTSSGGDEETVSYTATMSGNFETKSVSFDDGTASTTITIATTAKRAFIDNVKIYYVEGETPSTPTCEAPTFSVEEGAYTTAQSVTLSTNTEGATIYYTTNGDEPTTSSSVYSSAISVSTTTTIKAIAVKDGMNNSSVASATYTIVDHAGTQADPYTVADAHTAIDANINKTGVYATGIVSQIVTAYNSEYDNITFNFVTTSGDTEFLQAYRCGGDDVADVQVGDIVVVSGNLTKFGSTYEFGSGCTLVSLTHPVTPTITIATTEVNVPFAGASDIITVTYNHVDKGVADVYFCASDGTTAATYDWITADLDASGNVEYLVEENTGAARTAYFKVYGLDDEANYVYSELVTITQAKFELVSTFDLTTAKYTSASANEVVWNSTVATMVAAKAGATTNTNNYLGGRTRDVDGTPTLNTSTRFYKNSTITITPITGVTIGTITFEATTEKYATALATSTWTNATASASGTTVTVTPTNGAQTVSATIGGTTGHSEVTISYLGTPSVAPTYTRTVTEGNWGTICLPYDATVTGAKLYTISKKELDGSSNPTALILSEETEIAGGFPYIFKATGSELVATYTSSSYVDATDMDGLHGTYDAINDFSSYSEDLYLMTTSNVQAADKATSSLAANRAYILMEEVPTTGSPVKGVRLGFDGTEEATGITELTESTEKTEGTEGVIYNLNGQQLSAPQRGINIIGGKKVLVK